MARDFAIGQTFLDLRKEWVQYVSEPDSKDEWSECDERHVGKERVSTKYEAAAVSDPGYNYSCSFVWIRG
jgi:hypothetical protein